MREKIKIGISSCLLGEKVRYDGGHKLDPFLKDTFGRYVEWMPVCPEVESGLSVPREAMHLIGDPGSPRLVTIDSRIDHTNSLLRWLKRAMSDPDRAGLCGHVFKARSPSCGLSGVMMYSPLGTLLGTGPGIYAKMFVERFPALPVAEEGSLYNPAIRENFIERVFVFKRWLEYLHGDGSSGGLASFHASNKMFILAHSPMHYTILGKMVADTRRCKRDALQSKYIRTLMEGLGLVATVKKNTNVLQHIAGYFKDLLSPGERQELRKIIGDYHDGRVPLAVPLTLIRHYVWKYDVDYLKNQCYVNLNPVELMLRNHA
ncbi:MAG TPA: DUF523 and DUF1722 domain-containing protein [Nitrospirota bacterium]|nr:DUF523 and DUF1722 domain-containing protein [Nitrospirota bacterium]